MFNFIEYLNLKLKLQTLIKLALEICIGIMLKSLKFYLTLYRNYCTSTTFKFTFIIKIPILTANEEPYIILLQFQAFLQYIFDFVRVHSNFGMSYNLLSSCEFFIINSISFITFNFNPLPDDPSVPQTDLTYLKKRFTIYRDTY